MYQPGDLFDHSPWATFTNAWPAAPFNTPKRVFVNNQFSCLSKMLPLLDTNKKSKSIALVARICKLKRQIMSILEKRIMDKWLLEQWVSEKWFRRYGYWRSDLRDTGISSGYWSFFFVETGVGQVILDKWEFWRSEFGDTILEKWGTTVHFVLKFRIYVCEKYKDINLTKINSMIQFLKLDTKCIFK